MKDTTMQIIEQAEHPSDNISNNPNFADEIQSEENWALFIGKDQPFSRFS